MTTEPSAARLADRGRGTLRRVRLLAGTAVGVALGGVALGLAALWLPGHSLLVGWLLLLGGPPLGLLFALGALSLGGARRLAGAAALAAVGATAFVCWLVLTGDVGR